ncbi:hypothetical protein BSIN_4699 [Burkholderia singularis]|uniref:Uncharacterized protein n=1 Tax=Burkholderia singularis TaxID=1503053 RepID=A0A238H9V4_9BURK|nr:hypothetical protein BSIN_4699 [Burkholderia singularis]
MAKQMHARHAIFNLGAHDRAWPYLIGNAYCFATGGLRPACAPSRETRAAAWLA